MAEEMRVKQIIADLSTRSENSRQRMMDFHVELQSIVKLTHGELQSMCRRSLAIEFGDYKLRCGSLMAHGWAHLLYVWPKDLEDPLKSGNEAPRGFYLFPAGTATVLYPLPGEDVKILQQLKEFEAQ